MAAGLEPRQGHATEGAKESEKYLLRGNSYGVEQGLANFCI